MAEQTPGERGVTPYPAASRPDPLVHGKRPGNLAPLARELAERIERLPDDVEAWCKESDRLAKEAILRAAKSDPSIRTTNFSGGVLARSRIEELRRNVEQIRVDGAAVAHWVEHHRHPREAERFKEQLQDLQREIDSAYSRIGKYKGQEVFAFAYKYSLPVKAAAESLPKVLRDWADDMEAKAKLGRLDTKDAPPGRNPVIFTVTEAARYVGVAPKTMRTWIRTLKLKVAEDQGDKRYEFDRGELDAQREAQLEKKKRSKNADR